MFHVKDGLFFKREDNGNITVLTTNGKEPGEEGQNVIFETIITNSMLASVMASMSNRGETGDTYHEALAFLEKEPMKITVNGVEKPVACNLLTYATVVSLAFGTYDASKVYTVTHRYSAGKAYHGGSLSMGEILEVKEGTVINVALT